MWVSKVQKRSKHHKNTIFESGCKSRKVSISNTVNEYGMRGRGVNNLGDRLGSRIIHGDREYRRRGNLMAQINEVGISEVGEILGKAPNAISSRTTILGYYGIQIPVTEIDMHACVH